MCENFQKPTGLIRLVNILCLHDVLAMCPSMLSDYVCLSYVKTERVVLAFFFLLICSVGVLKIN